VGEFQQLISEQGRRSEAVLAPGRRLLAPWAGDYRSVEQSGEDGEYAGVRKATGDRVRWSNMEGATVRCRQQGGGRG
jgi:hypothetical protein